MSTSDSKPIDSLDNLKTAQPIVETNPEVKVEVKTDKSEKPKEPQKEDFIDKANDIVNPFNALPKEAKARLSIVRLLKARDKVSCYITKTVNDVPYLIQVKKVRADVQWFAAKGGSYHLDLSKVWLMANPPIMFYREGIAEPLEYKEGLIEGHNSDDLDMIERLQIVKQAFGALGSAKNRPDILLYVMIFVVGVAGLAIGYLLGSGNAQHIVSTVVPKTTSG